MPTTPRSFGGQIPVAKTTVYTAPVSVGFGATLNIIVTNPTLNAETFRFWRKPSGGTSQLISINNQPIGANEKAVIGEKIAFEPGDEIECQASTAAVLDYSISLVETTPGVVSVVDEDAQLLAYAALLGVL